MRITCREVLRLIVLVELGLAAGWANAEDAARDGLRHPEQIARTVEGSPPIDPTVEVGPAVSPANTDSYTILNGLLTAPSLLANTAREPEAAGWIAPAHPSDLADPTHDELGDLDDEVESQVDPNEPKSIELSQGVRGKLRAKSSGALLGIAIGFW